MPFKDKSYSLTEENQCRLVLVRISMPFQAYNPLVDGLQAGNIVYALYMLIALPLRQINEVVQAKTY